MTDKILYFPTEGTTGFWFNGVEIVNMEVIGVTEDSMNQCLHIKGKYLKPGDIFDLPDNYEFKEEEKSDGWMGLTKVLRLVKTETKDKLETLQDFTDAAKRLHKAVAKLEPEPEESQNEKEWERFWYRFGENDFDMRNAHKYYIIQRKKQ